MDTEITGSGKDRRSIQELWQESDWITQDILSHPWKYPLQYLMMLLGRFPDKLEKREDENKK